MVNYTGLGKDGKRYQNRNSFVTTLITCRNDMDFRLGVDSRYISLFSLSTGSAFAGVPTAYYTVILCPTA